MAVLPTIQIAFRWYLKRKTASQQLQLEMYHKKPNQSYQYRNHVKPQTNG